MMYGRSAMRARALLRRAGLPEVCHPILRAAMTVERQAADDELEIDAEEFGRQLIATMMIEFHAMPDRERGTAARSCRTFCRGAGARFGEARKGRFRQGGVTKQKRAGSLRTRRSLNSSAVIVCAITGLAYANRWGLTLH